MTRTSVSFRLSGREFKDSVAGARQHVRAGFSQGEDVASIQACAGLPPMRAAIVADECAAVLLVVYQSGVERVLVVWINSKRSNLAMSKADVGKIEADAGVIAGQYPATIRGQQHALRITRVDHDIVHDHVGRSDALPALAGVGGLP